MTLTATDAAANSASTTFTVTVASAPPPPPPKCVVPKLAGKTLSQARTALSRAHCKLGKVHQPKKPKHRRLRKLIVKSSSPGRGAVRANGTKVAVTLVEVAEAEAEEAQEVAVCPELEAVPVDAGQLSTHRHPARVALA